MASQRGYLTQSELAQFADITILDTTEADDQISQAEEVIDEYVGPQNKFFDYEITGLMSAGGSTSFTLQSDQTTTYEKNYLRGCWVEIMGGAAEGDRRKITAQTAAGVITVESAFSTTTDTTSFYRIFQLGKFPRHEDAVLDSQHSPLQWYKTIPVKVRRAVAAQVEYRINLGEKGFTGANLDMESETIGDYSYTRGAGSSGTSRLIAPKAKEFLAGIINRLGNILL